MHAMFKKMEERKLEELTCFYIDLEKCPSSSEALLKKTDAIRQNTLR